MNKIAAIDSIKELSDIVKDVDGFDVTLDDQPGMPKLRRMKHCDCVVYFRQMQVPGTKSTFEWHINVHKQCEMVNHDKVPEMLDWNENVADSIKTAAPDVPLHPVQHSAKQYLESLVFKGMLFEATEETDSEEKRAVLEKARKAQIVLDQMVLLQKRIDEQKAAEEKAMQEGITAVISMSKEQVLLDLRKLNEETIAIDPAMIGKIQHDLQHDLQERLEKESLRAILGIGTNL